MNGKITKVSNGANFTAINIGALESLLNYGEGNGKGKLFLKDELNATGLELSFAQMPTGVESPFFHGHTENEEVYIVLKGKGQMQIDEEVFDLSEGSLVRVAPKGKRCLRSADDSELIYITLQVKENSLKQWTMADGAIFQIEPKWRK